MRVGLAALLVFGLASLGPARVLAFECGGGSDWLESAPGEMCRFVSDGDLADPATTRPWERRMERYVSNACNVQHRRAIVAAARCEIALAQGRWRDADRFCGLASEISRLDADTHGAAASRAIARLHLGDRPGAVRLADAFARRECDTFERETSATFDQVSSCARAFGVLRAIDASMGGLAEREARFERQVSHPDARMRADRAFAACLVAGATPCRR